jgi:hypothetical protein
LDESIVDTLVSVGIVDRLAQLWPDSVIGYRPRFADERIADTFVQLFSLNGAGSIARVG